MAGKKRKLYKYAQFESNELCFYGRELSMDAVKQQLAGRDVVIELGAGNAQWARSYAADHPEQLIIAFDIKRDRLWQGARESEDLHNIIFVNDSAKNIASYLPTGSIAQIWITFPDPFFKKSQAKRRLTQPELLRVYAALLCSDGALNIKSDNQMFMARSVEYIDETGAYDIVRLETAVEAIGDGPEYYQTYYEQQWRESGQEVLYMQAMLRSFPAIEHK